MNYLTTNETAKLWKISNRRVQILASQGRIKGALKKSGVWLIPDNTSKPTLNNKNNHLRLNRRELKIIIKTITTEFSNYSSKELRTHILSAVHSLLISNLSKVNFNDDLFWGEYIFSKYLSDSSLNFNKKLYSDIRARMERLFDLKYNLEDILSWSYQYLNIFLNDNNKSNTQFFTENYMIDYLLDNTDSNISLFDPCCGGGNILTQAVEYYYLNSNSELEEILSNIVGYEIDSLLANIAVLNLKLKALDLLKRSNIEINFNTWENLTPNIFTSIDQTDFRGSLDKTPIINIETKEINDVDIFKNKFSNVITNPPFATIKGMDNSLSSFLKRNYPNSNSDICVAFLERLIDFSTYNGTILVVSQNSWMYLNSFSNFRENFLASYYIENIVDLGSGSFFDLSGEKSNVALIKFINKNTLNDKIKYYNLKNYSFEEKCEVLKSLDNAFYLNQNDILLNEKSRFDVLNILEFRNFFYKSQKVIDFATPMQGTSTGDNKKLVDYFWNRFNDNNWKLVSKGGGYSRWCGLNRYVVKWGSDAEFIKKQPGSALRNEKYFEQTKLVFSDTGTSGLNVRELRNSQLFIASGPGIRVSSGNHLALLAYLNSRVATYYIRILSPKLTIAAGYIANLPITQNIINSDFLATQANICLQSKKSLLMNRPNNIEYNFSNIQFFENDLTKTAQYLFLSELQLEYQKLLAEEQIEDFLNLNIGLQNEEIQLMYNELGIPVYKIKSVFSYNSLDIETLDKILDSSTNLTASLTKVKNAKHYVGSDGILEYLASTINTHPFEILRFIEDNISSFERIIKKYKNLILHNFILDLNHFDTSTGLDTSIQFDYIEEIQKQFSISSESITKWISETFPKVHNELFMGSTLINI